MSNQRFVVGASSDGIETLRTLVANPGDFPAPRCVVVRTASHTPGYPLFADLDLATFRNLLIYLNRRAQQRVVEPPHFALNPGGHLVVGVWSSRRRARTCRR